jgi:uncharacterized LabA/DUF88 family protein
VRVCIFVDGENFRHTIAKVFSGGEFDTKDYLPKKANWSAFFDWLVCEICKEGSSRLRTYWYTVEHIDFYPYRFPDATKETDSLRITLKKNPAFRTSLENPELSGAAQIGWMQERVAGLTKSQQDMMSRFRGWQVIQDGIANRHRAIEFRRAGAITYNLFDRKMGKEKAVDVLLATDMIYLKEIYDLAILVSGDQDYVPAVRRVKDAGKTVVNVAFKTKKGELLPGGARRLHNITDSSYEVSYEALGAHLKLFP